ncbi:MAG: hypothetical protein QMD94_00695 [Candidatus Omnitrophota bacterium]|nr:hypothetical protein [Candidatus Omnitrophota bacterium]
MNKKGLISLEAVLVISLVVAGFLSMQFYLKRAVSAKLKTNIDAFSDEQYDLIKSKVTTSNIVFSGSKITVKEIKDDKEADTPLATYNIASGSGILQVPGWGTYQ